MPAYLKGDHVEAKSDVPRPDITIKKGSRGVVTADSSSLAATARVKFSVDRNLPFRVVPKSKLKKL